MALLLEWGGYIWKRMARMDYWNPAHIPTNAPARIYKPSGPGFAKSREGLAPVLERSHPENIYSTRYFHRDHKVRMTRHSGAGAVTVGSRPR